MTEDSPHILVVDDDERLRKLLRKYLSDNGYLVSVAVDAAEARGQLAAMEFDLVVLDVMMPGESGFELARALRAEGQAVPILMLTAMGETEDRIQGLESGVDDYLAKPFEPRELLLRIASILRRAAAPPSTPAPAAVADIAAPPQLRFGEIVYDRKREELARHGVRIHLTTAEAALLGVLAERPNEVLSRDDLATATGAGGNQRSVDVQVTRLRKKLEDDARLPRYLQTVRGKGYLLRPD
ncbi:response regulator [Caenispirillum bisanense]|uniref:Two component transcriptional regulator, winged helix family n=1 Tax=Caenispirillum bisanense TaxID=414052 RepID=A0A286GA73_9PROT|nr:response regulator transcription factor [Caenispirillum bisanense]SOD92146.1 two component transcriptional regulator, winged helix family [Caenispirillum bisanense]